MNKYYPFVDLKKNQYIDIPISYDSIYFNGHISLYYSLVKGKIQHFVQLNCLTEEGKVQECWELKFNNRIDAINYFLLLLKFKFPKQYELFIIDNKNKQHYDINAWYTKYQEIIKYNNGIIP